MGKNLSLQRKVFVIGWETSVWETEGLLSLLAVGHVWLWAVLVVAGLAGLAEEHQKDDRADDREECPAGVPAGTACVMQAAETEPHRGQKDEEVPDVGHDQGARRGGVARETDATEDGDAPSDDGHEEGKPPVFRTRGAAGETAVFGEGALDGLAERHLILVHDVSVLRVRIRIFR